MLDESKTEPLATIDLSRVTASELRRRLADIDVPRGRDQADEAAVELKNSCGSHSMLMGLDRALKINVRGDLGDYAMAFNDEANIRVAGSVGTGLCESMVSGNVRIHGNAGAGVGVGMTGGTVAVYGNAGDGCAAALRGGEIFVRGNVGNNAATGALHGTLVVGGDAGNNLGESMMDAVIYIRGSIESLGHGVAEAPLTEKDRMRLGLLLINAGIRGAAKDFRRVVPQWVFDSEQKLKGVIGHPSWS